MSTLTQARTRATIAVRDLATAREFYEHTLGLTLEAERTGILSFTCGQHTTVDVYESEFAGTAKNTAMSFQVDDIDAAVSELQARGVTFDNYQPTTTDPVVDRDGIRGTWFHDPDGNTLGLIQIPSDSATGP